MRPAAFVLGALAGGVLLMASRHADASIRIELPSPAPAPGLPDDGDRAARNLGAFLDAIAWAEGTEGAGGYRALFGSRPGALSLFDSFADHPAALGWPGVRLSDDLCRAAGFGPGCVSTAAGRYQIIRPTWQRIAGRLGLQDFSPESQDAAAVELIREAGGLDHAQAGRFTDAVRAVRRVWASLPGAGYGQGERTLAELTAAYQRAGGVLA